MQILGIGAPDEEKKEPPAVVVKGAKDYYNIGDTVKIKVTNNQHTILKIVSECPGEPLDVFRYTGGEWSRIAAKNDLAECSDLFLKTGESTEISYGPWKQGLFDKQGSYKIALETVTDNENAVYFTEFEIGEPGFLKNLWNKLFYKPIYNSLIWLIAVMPQSFNLALAIIVLTIFIKLILLGPNNKAIRSQKEMQKIQPLLEEIKQKYAGDNKKISAETMNIWKEHKVNPFGSCLPLMIQFPIMIALFYVIKNGLSIEENRHLLYSFLQNREIFINPSFFGLLDLTKQNLYVLPVIIGGLQFLQMKLSFAKKAKEGKKKDKQKESKQAQFQAMNATLQYVLPVMIAVFTASLPAAVGIYWGVSTSFAIVQQSVVNKK